VARAEGERLEPGREVDDVEFKVVLFLPRDAASVPITCRVPDAG